MTIDTENDRRSVGSHPMTTVLPVPDGSIDAADRFHVSWLYRGVAVGEGRADEFARLFRREPTWLVSITVQGDVAGEYTFHFSPKDGRPLSKLLGLDVRAYILGSPQGRPTRIQPDKAVTQRGSLSISFTEDPNAPAFPSANFSITTGGGFWRRLVLTQPDYRGSAVEIQRGFIFAGMTTADFRTVFKGVIDDISFQTNSTVTLVAKDALALEDRQIPQSISDNNLVDGAILAADSTFDVDSTSEITAPTSLDSKDLWPVTLRLEPGTGNEEDVIVGGVSGFTVTAQANYLDKSEKFDNAQWVKSSGATVTADQSVGPLGGDPRADKIDLAAATDMVSNDSGVAASGISFVFSVWLRAGPDQSQPVPICLDLILSDASELFQNAVELTDKWQRFQVATSFIGGAGQTAVVRIRRGSAAEAAQVSAWGAQLEKASQRGFYVPTDGNDGAAAGRGAFGSTAVGHADDSPFKEIVPYRTHAQPEGGVHPVAVLRDLVNRGAILSEDVDQPAFDVEFNFVEGVQVKQVISEPRKLSQHTKELRAQALLDLWVSEEGEVKTRWSFRQNLPGTDVPTLTDEANILFRGAAVKGNTDSRITRAYVYFDLIAGQAGDKPEHFNNIHGNADLGVEALSGQRAKSIFSKWIFREAEAIALAGRLVSRFRRGARIISLDLDVKDEPDFFTGDVVAVDSIDVLKKSGSTAVRGPTQWQVVQKKFRSDRGRITFEGLEFSGLRYAIISPANGLEDPGNPFPDYPNASERERAYGFIGDIQNNVASALTIAPFTLTTATYTAATKRVAQTGAFSAYTWLAGDALFPIHASAYPAFYLIKQKIDNDTIELEEAIKNVSDGATDSGDLVNLANDTAKWRDELVNGYFIL